MSNYPFPRVHPSRRRVLLITAASLTVAATSAAAFAGPILPEGMTDLSEDFDGVTSLSDDGRTVVGWRDVTVGFMSYRRAARWTVGSPAELFDFVQDAECNDMGMLVTADGAFFYGSSRCGTTDDGSFIRWDAGGGVVLQASPGALFALGGMTPDGTTVVGLVRQGPFSFQGARWNAEEGNVLLEDVPGGDVFSTTRDISDDGLTIVGNGQPEGGSPFSQWVPCAWFGGGTAVTELGSLDPDDIFGSADAISADGSTIVGWSGLASIFPFEPVDAFIWTESEGMQEIPGMTIASEIAPDGSWVIGTRDDGGQGVWRPGLGVVPVADWLDELGFAVPEAIRSTLVVRGVSTDQQAFMASDTSSSAFYHYALPDGSCLGDLDGSGVVDFSDVLSVLGNWGGAGGDVDGDGTTDFADVLAVLAAWGPCG